MSKCDVLCHFPPFIFFTSQLGDPAQLKPLLLLCRAVLLASSLYIHKDRHDLREARRPWVRVCLYKLVTAPPPAEQQRLLFGLRYRVRAVKISRLASVSLAVRASRTSRGDAPPGAASSFGGWAHAHLPGHERLDLLHPGSEWCGPTDDGDNTSVGLLSTTRLHHLQREAMLVVTWSILTGRGLFFPPHKTLFTTNMQTKNRITDKPQ